MIKKYDNDKKTDRSPSGKDGKDLAHEPITVF